MEPNTSCRDPNIVCHKNAVNANVSATVAAGGTVQFQWTTWPHNIGPVLTYVANCGGDCKSVGWILSLQERLPLQNCDDEVEGHWLTDRIG